MLKGEKTGVVVHASNASIFSNVENLRPSVLSAYFLMVGTGPKMWAQDSGLAILGIC